MILDARTDVDSEPSQVYSYFMWMYPILIALGLQGSLIGVLYSALAYIYKEIKERMVSEVHIRYDDDTFLWVNKYLQDMGYIKRNNNLKARVKQDNGPWWETIFKARDTKKLPELEYKAGGGVHYFTYKGKSMWVHHREGETLITGWERTPTLQEDIFICTSGSDTTIIKEFITAAIKHCVDKEA